MIAGSLLLLALFLFPMWNITLEAPQYPIPLGMDIHINKFTDTNEFDIKNINLLNHYVGMKEIPHTIPEFKFFPLVVGVMISLGVLIGLFGNYRLFLVWFILMCLLGAAGIYDFYIWEHNYGHNLNPKAILQFTNADGTPMGFQPPLFGSKDILNFKAHSYPRIGAYFLFIGMFMSFIAFFIGKKRSKNAFKKLRIPMKKIARFIIILLLATISISCSIEPEPIEFGKDYCHSCKMNIVDKTHAAQYVTSKGKQFKFDAIECMVNDLSSKDDSQIAIINVANYSNPGEMIPAKNATYLISSAIKSPMGMNLSAFKKETAALEVQQNHEGVVYTWQTLSQFISTK